MSESLRVHSREWWGSRPIHVIEESIHAKVIIAFANGAITERKTLSSFDVWESCEHWQTCLFVDTREYRVKV